MATEVQSHMVPAGKNCWYILEDSYLKGGLRSIKTLRHWSSVPMSSRKSGGFVIAQDTHQLYLTDHDLVHLKEFRLPAARKRTRIQYITPPMLFLEQHDFMLPMAMSNTVYELIVSNDCIINAYGTPEMDEENPYEFYAKGEGVRRHDVGYTYLEDGTISKNQKFFRLTNLEDPPKEQIFFSIISKVETSEPSQIQVDIWFYPEEY